MNGPSWRVYERIAAAFIASNEGTDISVTPNARITGSISGTRRQIDVLIDARWGDDFSRRVIVDAKRYRGRVDIKDVEAFEAMMRDCRASRGIIVCPNGWTDGARRRAQDAITIMLLSIEDAEDETWWAHFDACLSTCAHRPDWARRGLVLWDAQHLLALNGLFAVVFTGKCDVCHSFHVWCWDCGAKFGVGHEQEHRCYCVRDWVSVVEEDVDAARDTLPNAEHLILVDGAAWIPLDRRMLQ